MVYSIIQPAYVAGRQQPQGDMQIDWSHPLAKNLTMCLMPSAFRGGILDMTGKVRAITPGVITRNDFGQMINTWSITNASSVDLAFLTGPWAVAAWSHLSTAPSTSGQNSTPIGRINYTSETVNAGIALQVTGGATPTWGFISFANNGAASYTLPGSIPAGIGNVLLGGTSDGSTTRRLFVNGSADGTIATNLNPATTTGNLTPFVSTQGVFDGSYLLLAWARDVIAAEWAWLNAEPYCFMTPRMTFSFYDVSAGAQIPYQPWGQRAPILAQ